ncbi:MAG: hypothetical protein SPF89_03635 [Sphaerochaetaceae bacterium]|nr:hypothetical protein [Spirochaetales bacterium]MDY5499176.1 hypothetical protein [Sphaerochaetaceae bacterium]
MSVLAPSDLRKTYNMNLPASADAVWQDCIDTAEDQCRRVLDVGGDWSAQRTAYFDAADVRNGLLALGRAPVLALRVWLDDGSRTWPGLLDAGSYRLDPETGIVVLYGSPAIPEERDAVKAEFTYGWTADSIPAGIKRAIAWTAQYIAKMTGSNQIGISQRTNVDGGTESIEQSMVPAAVMKTLDYYRTGRIV